jgi:hypothetical protein
MLRWRMPVIVDSGYDCDLGSQRRASEDRIDSDSLCRIVFSGRNVIVDGELSRLE